MHAQAKSPGQTKTKILEPVSGTSRRGASTLYYDDATQDFGSKVDYTVS